MSDWHEGYVADVPYSVGYYREMSPPHMAFAALAVGRDPAALMAPRRILELGFGMGVGFVLGAATDPDCFYEGCDFNPEHITHARSLAEDAGLDNVLIREASFQELAAEAREGQHDLDAILLHGILTWVSAEAHEAIMEIARKRLKPGGYLYVSYNSMPGWASFMPVQRLMREHAKRHGGGTSSIARTSAAMAAVKQMAGANGRFFTGNPSVQTRLDKVSSLNASYLAHEYLNENWFIFHVADVVAMMEKAKLGYIGSATIAENIEAVAVPADMQPLVAQASDPIWKETLKDFAANKQFRRDMYGRGIASLNAGESARWLKRMRFTLSLPRSAVTLKFAGPLQELDGKAEIYGPIADMLDGRVLSFDEIASSVPLRQVGAGGVLQALALLVHSNQVLPVTRGGETDFAPAQRYNRMVADRATTGRIYGFLAAPLASTGIGCNMTELLFLDALFKGQPHQPEALMRHVVPIMRSLGLNPLRDGVAITEENKVEEVLTGDAASFLSQKYPVWHHLGIV